MSLPSKVNFGPWMGAAFLKQVGLTVDRVKATQTSQSELFTSFLPAIAHDHCLDPSVVGDQSWVDRMFEKLTISQNCRLKGPDMQLCRWMSWIDCIDYWDDCWHLRLCLMMYWAIDEGLVVHDRHTIQINNAARFAGMGGDVGR